MVNNHEAFQQLGQQNVETTIKLFGEWSNGWRTIGAEMSDFTKRSVEDAIATFEKLLRAKSLDGNPKRLHDAYLRRLLPQSLEDRWHVRAASEGFLPAAWAGFAEFCAAEITTARPRQHADDDAVFRKCNVSSVDGAPAGKA